MARVARRAPSSVAAGCRDVGRPQCIERDQDRGNGRFPLLRAKLFEGRSRCPRRDAVPDAEGFIDLDDLWDRQVSARETCGDPVALEVLEVAPEPNHQVAAGVGESEAARPCTFSHVFDFVGSDVKSLG